MTLPDTDLTAVVAALSDIYDSLEEGNKVLQLVADELEKMNARERDDVDKQVKDIRETLERQYRDTITNLENRLPKNASPIPTGWTRDGGLGDSTGPASP